jgi:hypothetical protein
MIGQALDPPSTPGNLLDFHLLVDILKSSLHSLLCLQPPETFQRKIVSGEGLLITDR